MERPWSHESRVDRQVGGIPAIDLAGEYAGLKDEIDAAILRVVASGRYVGGPEVEEFEREFAAFCGVPHAVGVASGTDALRFALMAVGLGNGPDEVITSPLTFIATTEAVSQAGGRPVFVDVDPESLTLNPGRLEQAMTPRTRAIVPVHLYGQTADMGPILEMARANGLAVIEDACQAHGAQYRGRSAGSIGDAGAFSFYPTKNLGACGEGGMITTARADVADRVRRLRDHGQSGKYVHAEEGFNGRLDAVQAAILRVKLKRLSAWNERRWSLAARYSERLHEMGLADSAGVSERTIRLPVAKAWGTHVYHLYTIRLGSSRDRVRAALLEKGIETGVHYPVPLHLQPCYARVGLGKGSFPVAERASREVLSLPLFPQMTEAQVDRVCEALREALGRG